MSASYNTYGTLRARDIHGSSVLSRGPAAAKNRSRFGLPLKRGNSDAHVLAKNRSRFGLLLKRGNPDAHVLAFHQVSPCRFLGCQRAGQSLPGCSRRCFPIQALLPNVSIISVKIQSSPQMKHCIKQAQ